MTWHVIAGAAGCAHAATHGCAALVVDALRASATAAMLCEHGARAILVTRGVDEARALAAARPGALLYGEREGLPPEGFHHGNSPAEAVHARDRDVIFTTTTGAQRLADVAAAPAAAMATTVNARAAVAWAQAQGRDVTVIPAGLASDPDFNAQEDWAAAAWLVECSGAPVGEGREAAAHWRRRIAEEGLPRLFETAPHAENLRRLGLADDLVFCARTDVTSAVPAVTGMEAGAARLACWRPPRP